MGHPERIVVAATSVLSARDGPGVQAGERLSVKLGAERLVIKAAKCGDVL